MIDPILAVDSKVIKKLTDIADISMRLGETNRATKHPTGRLETDTTHTIMLQLVCCTVNDEFSLGLDSGLICELACVHDLHEAICGDTNTLRQDNKILIDKEAKENSALESLYTRFPGWISERLSMYHTQNQREARFVRGVDKLLPKLTHILNHCRVLKEQKMTRSEFQDSIMVKQFNDMQKYCGDFPPMLELHKYFGQVIKSQLPDTYGDCR